MLYNTEVFHKNLEVKEPGEDYGRGRTEQPTLLSTSKDGEEKTDDRCNTYLGNWKAGEETDGHPTHKNCET